MSICIYIYIYIYIFVSDLGRSLPVVIGLWNLRDRVLHKNQSRDMCIYAYIYI